MYISLMNSLSSGFRKWSDAHQPDCNDIEDGRETPIPISDPPVDGSAGISEQAHQPWLVPGVGKSF
jgi:hypothetical protein